MEQNGRLTRAKEAKQKSITLPTRFEPRYWESADQRCSVVRRIKSQYEALKQDCGADSVAKDWLCMRASFLHTLLCTWEIECAEGNGIDMSAYVQAQNGLQGALAKLGLNRHQKRVLDLQSYVATKAKSVPVSKEAAE